MSKHSCCKSKSSFCCGKGALDLSAVPQPEMLRRKSSAFYDYLYSSNFKEILMFVACAAKKLFCEGLNFTTGRKTSTSIQKIVLLDDICSTIKKENIEFLRIKKRRHVTSLSDQHSMNPPHSAFLKISQNTSRQKYITNYHKRFDKLLFILRTIRIF